MSKGVVPNRLSPGLSVNEHAQLILVELVREYIRRQGDDRLTTLGSDFGISDYIPSVLVSHRESMADTAYLLATAFRDRAIERDF